MSSLNTQHLHELFTIFDVPSLGEGDPVAGANILAAMACSIANVREAALSPRVARPSP